MGQRRTRSKSYQPSPSSEDGGFFYTQNPKIPQIVITGGPACGKTTGINRLKSKHEDITTISEASTQVLASGFPVPNSERPWTQTWQNALQLAIAGHQLGLELIAQEDAKKQKKRAILQDRGLLDGAAYLEGGLAELEGYTGTSTEEMLGRYHTVIFLGSLASYDKKNNPHRFEEEARALALSGKTLAAWQDHPRLIELTGIAHRNEEIDEAISQILNNLDGGQQ